jgi:hypothetical protein
VLFRSKAIVVSKQLRSLSTLRSAHGLKDVSQGGSRIAELRVRIGNRGTFQEFNDVVAALTRLCYIDNSTRWRAISLPSAKSNELRGIELSLAEILGRIPGLESLYRMTFGEDSSRTEPITLETAFQDDKEFRVALSDSQLFDDRESLRKIVNRLRSNFPFLKNWRLNAAQYGFGKSQIYFRNTRNTNIDEFSEEYLVLRDGSFTEGPVPGDQNVRFSLDEGFHPVTGGYTGGSVHAISPVFDLYLSEFSVQYLGLYLLSSLMRYRPQIWTHAISRTAAPNEPVDDKALSLIERFLDLNGDSIPEMVVRILNPCEDHPFG